MEKMNQVSVSEFMSKSKEEMYDMAVEMVEKHNRLVYICNDSAERMAELAIERDNLSKGVQKLIGERDDLVERHNVYTSALNNDIAEKAAKIELLEKEIEGRKEGYTALKELMDTKYISIDEHNKIVRQFEEKIERQKENLNAINKTLETRTKEKESLIAVRNNQDREIEAHESENARLTKKIMELKKELAGKDEEIEKLKVDLDFEREKYEKMAKANAEMETNMRKKCFSKSVDYRELEEKYRSLEQYNKDLKEKNEKLKGELNKTKKTLDETIQKWIPELKKYDLKTKEDDHGRAGFKKYIEWIVKEEEAKFKESWKARLNEELATIFKEEEKTEVRIFDEYHKYNWFPCGEDSIE